MNKATIGFVCLLLALSGAVVPLAQAQEVTTAAINGTMIDQSGEALPLANVIAVHVPTGTIYGISTREDGRYNLQGLKVGGPYTVTASLVGYKEQKLERITLTLGQNLRLDFTLVAETVELGEVNVMADRTAIISSSRTGAGTNVSTAAIERLPSISRSFQDFQRLTPQFLNNSAAGRNNRMNNIQIDGANVNDLFGLGASGTPGGQASTQPISLDALQEFQVVVAPYDVRQGGFTGGGVNAITRSGTNQYSGSAYWFGRNQNQVGLGPVVPRQKVAEFSENQGGFRIGGPLLKDKLFFFLNGEITRRRAPSDVTLGGAGITGTNVSVIPADTAAKFASILRNRYGYDPGSTDPLVARRQSNKLFLRFDYNLSSEHRLTLRHNFVDAFDDNLSRTISSFYFENSNYVFNSTSNQTVLQLSSSLGRSFANEMILGYTRIRDSRDYVGSPFPFVRINYNNNTNLVLAAGTENFSQANTLDQDIFEVTDNFTWFAGSNVFTFGTHNEFYKFANLFIRNLYGYYEFPSVAAFDMNRPSRYQASYSLTPDPQQDAEFKALQLGLYGQVESSILPNLKVTAGVRLDIPSLPDKPSYNYLVDSTFAGMGIGTNKVPGAKLLWSPRVGVNWDVENNRMTQVRGGVGIFTGRIPYVWLSNQYGNTGVEFARLDISNAALLADRFSPDPNNQPRSFVGVGPIKTSEIDVTDPAFKMPQLLRFNAAVDRQLPFDLVGTIEFIYSKTVNDLVYEDINLRPIDSLASDGRALMGRYGTGTKTTANKVNARDFTNVLLMKNTSEGYQWGITAQLQRPLSHGLFGTLAYTYGRSKDRNSVLSSQAYSQWRFNPVPGNPNAPPLTYSAFDRPHKVIASISYQHEWFVSAPTTISVFYSGYSGEPYSYVISGDVNGDGETSNDLVYVPKDASDILLTTNNYAALDAYIEGEEYLRDNRGKIVERNGGRVPWVAHIDLRVAQDIPVFEGHTFEFTIDVLNIGNMFSKNWGKERYVPNQTYTLLKYEGLDPATRRLRYSYAPPTNNVPWQYNDLYSRWQAQLGVRYMF